MSSPPRLLPLQPVTNTQVLPPQQQAHQEQPHGPQAPQQGPQAKPEDWPPLPPAPATPLSPPPILLSAILYSKLLRPTRRSPYYWRNGHLSLTPLLFAAPSPLPFPLLSLTPSALLHLALTSPRTFLTITAHHLSNPLSRIAIALSTLSPRCFIHHLLGHLYSRRADVRTFPLHLTNAADGSTMRVWPTTGALYGGLVMLEVKGVELGSLRGRVAGSLLAVAQRVLGVQMARESVRVYCVVCREQWVRVYWADVGREALRALEVRVECSRRWEIGGGEGGELELARVVGGLWEECKGLEGLVMAEEEGMVGRKKDRMSAAGTERAASYSDGGRLSQVVRAYFATRGS